VPAAEAHRPAPDDHIPFGLLFAAIVGSLIVSVLLLSSNSAVLAIASGTVYLVGLAAAIRSRGAGLYL
jgi:hypothetical protein